MRLTLAGADLVLEVRRWFADAERLQGALDSVRGPEQPPTVRIATMGFFERGVLPDLVAQFREKHPGVSFEIQSPARQRASIFWCRGEWSTSHWHSTCRNRHDIQRLAALPWPIGVVVNASHPLAAEDSLRLVDCVPYDVVLPDDTLALSAIVRGFWHAWATAVRLRSPRTPSR